MRPRNSWDGSPCRPEEESLEAGSRRRDREAAAVRRPAGRLLHARPASRAHAAVGSAGRGRPVVPGSRGPDPGPRRGGRARAVRQGAGDPGGPVGPRLLADRARARAAGRRRVAGDILAHPPGGRGRTRMRSGTARRAAPQAADLRAGRLLLTPPRHREGRRHGRHTVDLAAGRGRRRRAGRPAPRSREHHRHDRRRTFGAGVRGVLRGLLARGPAGDRGASPVARLQSVPACRRHGHAPGGPGPHRGRRSAREPAGRVGPRPRRDRQADLAARSPVQRGGAVLRRVQEHRRRRGGGAGAGRGTRRVRSVRGRRPYRGIRRRGVRRVRRRLGLGRYGR